MQQDIFDREAYLHTSPYMNLWDGPPVTQWALLGRRYNYVGPISYPRPFLDFSFQTTWDMLFDGLCKTSKQALLACLRVFIFLLAFYLASFF